MSMDVEVSDVMGSGDIESSYDSGGSGSVTIRERSDEGGNSYVGSDGATGAEYGSEGSSISSDSSVKSSVGAMRGSSSSKSSSMSSTGKSRERYLHS